LKILFEITGSWRFNYRWDQLYWILENITNDVVCVLIWKIKFENFDFFFHLRWWPEVTADMTNPPLHTLIEISIISENFMALSFIISEKMEKQVLNLWTPYLITGSGVLKIIFTLLETFLVSTTYIKFKSNTLVIKKI
jgi:hypothetical protein